MYTFVFAQNWWSIMLLLMNSLLIVVVVVMRCCCWWLKPWVILTIELEVILCCSWRFSWKMGQMVIFVEMMFWFKFYMDLSVFSCLETFRQTLGSNLGIGKSNWDFGVKNRFFPRATYHSSPWRVIWLPWRVQQLSNSPCRVTASPVSRSCVLGSQCNHGSFR